MSNGDLSGNVRVLATAVGDGVAASIAASSGVLANNAGTPAIATGGAAAVILSNTRVSVGSVALAEAPAVVDLAYKHSLS